MPSSSPRYLTTSAAAEHLGVSCSTLSHARGKEKGPPFSHWPCSSIVRYDVHDLDAWMAKLKTLGSDGAPPRKRRRGAPSKAEAVARRLRQNGLTVGGTSEAPGKSKARRPGQPKARC
ncbi:hypothetical protein J2851_005384 [Azospirillum rugosum]|uniref:Helix-turn-helix domain-containing protein n=1 Tax=Azospirillum rugosum TaxID=416170 RepID=A0ABS4SSN4_9PROT|nr:hypothetical protein [Azospirillum rugosum]MDQ0529537.1 hypothetical protein [Azospirillum rugosum]